MTQPIVVALIDGPIDDQNPALRRSISFAEGDAHPAARRHAQAMVAAIAEAAPDIEFVNLQIFGPRLTTSAAVLAQALRTAAEERPAIVHCSFGLERRDEEISTAVASLLDSGTTVVAAAPARGAITYPAALPQVLSVQGDARCGPGEWSHLDLPTALFGAHAQSLALPDIRGSSVAAAYFTGLLAAQLASGLARDAAVAKLKKEAHFQGRERRLA